MIGKRLGPYEVVAKLGEGGMGEVYRATDTNLKRQVAIKVLPASVSGDPDRLARFQREAEVLAALNHPNIAQIYGLEKSGGTIALVMELVEGPTLADRLAHGAGLTAQGSGLKAQGLPLDEALPIAKQIADALEAAHEQGIVHRDLKPANIKVRPDGTVKVLDFGLAKLIEKGSGIGDQGSGDAGATAAPTITTPAMTQAGVILGTAAYMSPEQAKGRPADKRSDIWTFGCVLYEMLTGTRPFQADDISETLAAILRADPDLNALPKSTPEGIRRLLRRCLEKDARKRCQAAGDLRVEIEDALAASQGLDIDEASSPPTPRFARVATLVVLAAVAGAALAGGLLWAFRPAIQPSRMTRFSFSPPAPFTGTNRDVIAISPDGASVVFAASNRLYLRRMDEIEAHPIPGTDGGAQSPFFSPDGQWVGFFSGADNTLKKIATGGGAAVTLCPAGTLAGGSWGGDTIVFGQFGLGILTVPSGGGKPEVWVKTSEEEVVGSPQILPGGNAVLFSIAKIREIAQSTNRWDGADIVVALRGSGERKVLVRGGSAARYIPTGHVVYAVGSDLFAVRFDLERLEINGNPVPIVGGVMRSTGVTPANLTDAANVGVSQNGSLVYILGDARAIRAFPLIWVDRQGREEPSNAPPRNYLDMRLSPEAQRIAVAIPAAFNDVWTFDFARGGLTRQTFEADEDETPVWSPDGRWIAYSSIRGNRRIVFRRRADGSGPEEALWSARLPAHSHVQDWTGDGTSLIVAVSEADTGQSLDLMLLPVDGARALKPLVQSRFNEQGARVSPDRRWVAYSSDESGRDEVYVRPFPALDGKWQISTGGGYGPVWSRRGDELFYRGEASVMAVHISTTPSFSASPPQKLFEDHFGGAANHPSYDVSPDGRRFLMVGSGSIQASTGPQIVVVMNWSEELKRLVPVN